MTEPITIRVFGEPKGQPRPRAFARKIGAKFVARVFEAGTAEGWKGCIALAAKEFAPTTPLNGPLRVHSFFIFRRPKSHFRSNGMLKETAPEFYASRPDRDNLDKAALDCLSDLNFWVNDSLVCTGIVEKRYAKLHEAPGAIFVIAPVELAEVAA